MNLSNTMKTSIISLATVSFMLAAAGHVRAEILAGPITNPANGHDYYLLTPNTWTASEAEAENLGGTLAIVKNDADQEWLYSKFGSYGGITNRTLWIGLRRETRGGPFEWVRGDKLDYTNWGPGQPDDCGGDERFVHIWSHTATCPGKWNDAENGVNLDGSAPCGVVEIPGKETSLNKREKSLIGTWYETGKCTRPCYITATKNKLFQIYFGQAVRLYVPGKTLVLMNGIRGELVQDKILWSNGTWWSRTEVDYSSDGSSAKNTDTDLIKD